MIYTIGETLLDIIFRGGQPVAARPGGAMLNTAVSVGRCGIPVNLISEIGMDQAGENILEFLENNGVGCSFIHRFQDGKTAIAMAFLDEESNAGYSFYKLYPETRLPQRPPQFQSDDILLFGSFYALSNGVRDKIVSMVQQARDAGAFIIYDPNIRSPHKHEMEEKRWMVLENMRLSRLVRGSDEDFRTIFDLDNARAAWDICHSCGCEMLIYTMNRKGVLVMTENVKKHFSVPVITPVSTIGAGDSFNAGIIYELAQGTDLEDIEAIVNRGIGFSEEVCLSFDNYISSRK